MLSNEFIKELVKVPNKIDKKDMHSVKLEVSTKKFESKKAASYISAHFGIASYTNEPIMTQRKDMNIDANNKNSHVYIKFKLNKPSDDITRILQ